MRYVPLVSGALLLLVASSASADTIVLKNGRRIIASNVIEDGDHVRYETPAGQMSIPKSIVAAHRPRQSRLFRRRSAASSAPPVSAPEIDPLSAAPRIFRSLVVHNDAIDFVYIAQVGIRPRAPAAPRQ